MEESVFLIEGKVKYKLTIDPSVWIFDDRRLDLGEQFKNEKLHNYLAIHFKPFIENAIPNEDAVTVKIVTHSNKEIKWPIELVKDSFLCFAIGDHAITENGPVYLYFRDGSNIDQPIINIKKVVIE